MKKTSKISQAISSLLLLLVLFGVFGLLFTFTNGFKEDFKTFYVSYNGQDIFATESKLELARDEEYRFDVTYTFDFVDKEAEAKDYNVKIVSNMEKGNEFDFTVDGKAIAYTDGLDLTKGFDIKKDDACFTLTLSDKLTLQTILETVYGGEVEVPSLSTLKSLYLYTLVVSSYDESVTYYIDFCFKVEAARIEINPNEVVF